MSDMQRNFGTVLEDVSCDQVARRVMRASVTWAGSASLFVYPCGTVICMAPGTWAHEKAMRNDSSYLVGVYEWRSNEEMRGGMLEAA